MKKLVSINEIEQISKQLKEQNKKVVTTNGCFDILHVGHVRYLQEAKELGDVLIIGLNSDSSVKKIKGPSRPINNELDRAEVIGALACVDYVVIFEEQTAVNLLAKIKPNIYAKGGDYNPDTLPETKVVLENGGKLEFIKFVEGKSTTNIINQAKNK